MAPAGFLGASDATFGAVLGVAWLLILAATAARYRRGTLAGPKATLMGSATGVWLGFSLLQIASGVDGAAELLVAALAAACFGGGLAAGYRWWTTRDEASG